MSYLDDPKNNLIEMVEWLKNESLYGEMRYYILPKIPNSYGERTFYLPDYDIQLVHELLQDKYNINVSKELNSKIKAYVELVLLQHMQEMNSLLYEWNIHKSLYLDKLEKQFPEITFELEVIGKYFGTICSYHTNRELDTTTITILPRFDATLESIARTAVIAIIHKTRFFELNTAESLNTWVQKQQLGEEIANKLFPINQSLLQIFAKKTNGELAVKSLEYLDELGLKIPSYHQKIEKYFLTENETKLFELLVKNKGCIVTYDEIADSIWGNDVLKKYSLEAITKLIQRLRKKILFHGIYTELIHTVTSKGYVLYEKKLVG